MDRKPKGLLTIVVLLLAGCGGSGGGGGGTNNPPPTPNPPPTGGGLDSRPVNATCVAPSRATGTLAVQLTPAYPSLPSFTQPIGAFQRPGDNSRWYVVEQRGTVRAFDNDSSANASDLVIDISQRVLSGGERGLLGARIPPQFCGQWAGIPLLHRCGRQYGHRRIR